MEGRDEIVETFLYELFDLNDWESESELYWGHDDNGRGLYPLAIKDERSKIWANYKEKLRSKNSFLFETEAKSIFSQLLVDLKMPLKNGAIYYRARIGYTEKNQKIGTSNIQIKTPFTHKEMSAPPI